MISSSEVSLESAGDILARIYREGAEPGERDEQVVLSFWAPTVGAQIANRTRPVRLYQGRLVVDVEGHDWRRQLAKMSYEITEKLNIALGRTLLEGIDFRVKGPQLRPPQRALAANETSENNVSQSKISAPLTAHKR